MTTWNDIYKLNTSIISNPNLIYPGQVLAMPDDSTYTVVSGDTLNGIARKFDASKPAEEPSPPPSNPTTDENQKSDDADANTTEQTTNVVDTGEANQTEDFSSPTLRQNNPLSEFSSSTYRVSLYALIPEAYENFHNTGRWDKRDMLLVAQSGGITEGKDSKRAAGFELDFYIDNLEIETMTSGKETAIAGNQLNFKFQIFEPYGMTFPTKLVRNQVQIQQMTNSKRNVTQQIEALQGHFLLIVRFYGYDLNGKLITSLDYQDGGFKKTDDQAVFERAFPIIISKFSFRIDNKVTVYDINAKMAGEQIATGIKRGTVASSANVEGEIVSEAIGGLEDSKYLTTGLLGSLNAEQDKQVKLGKYEIADKYRVVFENNPAIKDALLVDKDYNKSKAPLAKVNSAGEVTERKSYQSSKIVRKKRTIRIESGTPIVQAIDQIISQSSYISDALTFKDKEESTTVQDTDKTYDENSSPKTLSWYIIVPKVVVLGYDNLRNDYAYEITYVVKRYAVPYVRSLAYKYAPKYYGPHKKYNYWYTGQNTEVLSYEQTYNMLYFNTGALGSEAANKDAKDNAPRSGLPATNADPTSLMSGAFEAANSVKTFLYSPGDQLKASIKILGDPDYLMSATSGTVGEIMKQWYGDDFTINPNSGQVFIEIMFNQVEDYGNNGLLSPNGDIVFWDYPKELKTFIKGMVYMLVKVTSRFAKGTFTQELKTVLPNFDDMVVSGQENQKTNRMDSIPKSTTAGAGRGGQGGPSATDSNASINAKAENDAEVARLAKKYPAPPATANDDQTTYDAMGNVIAGGRE